tara:strand:+ start:318 stop:830 length:513 start_codon:yes stop_codon:yes gene_type:complete
MTEATIQRCSDDHCINGLQRVHETVKATRPGYCSWCWNEIPATDPTAAVVKRLIDARDLLINGNDFDAIEWTIGAIESSILDLGGSLPIYRVRGVMLHDTKEPDYTYVDQIFESVDKGQDWIDGEFSDAFVDACTVDTEVDPTLEGYQFDDFEIVRVASPEFPIEVMEVM